MSAPGTLTTFIIILTLHKNITTGTASFSCFTKEEIGTQSHTVSQLQSLQSMISKCMPLHSTGLFANTEKFHQCKAKCHTEVKFALRVKIVNILVFAHYKFSAT
jgi:hypothetical protein